MQLPYQQWVDYGDWASGYSEAEGYLWISFKISNLTDYPLTLPAAFVRFVADEEHGTQFTFRPNCLLLPNRQPTDVVRFSLSEVDVRRYYSTSSEYEYVEVRVIGDVSHIGSPLGKTTEQLFTGILRCSKDYTRFEEETPPEGMADKLGHTRDLLPYPCRARRL